jgi:hypothetical protein
MAAQQKHKHSRALLLHHLSSMLLGYVLKLQDGTHVCCKAYSRILLAWSVKPFLAKSVSRGKREEKTNNLIRSSGSAPKSLSVDHKPTCLFFLIGEVMSAVVSSKIHTDI